MPSILRPGRGSVGFERVATFNCGYGDADIYLVETGRTKSVLIKAHNGFYDDDYYELKKGEDPYHHIEEFGKGANVEIRWIQQRKGRS